MKKQNIFAIAIAILGASCSSNVKMIEKTDENRQKKVAREKAAVVSDGTEPLKVATGKVSFKKIHF